MDYKKPPMLPPIEQFRISKENATQKSIEARQKLFETEKGKTYLAIHTAADNGNYYLEYKYPENCNNGDILELQKQLISEGFKVDFDYGLYGDKLKISWYPEE